MARPKKPKTGVMPGFPKLAFYIGDKIHQTYFGKSWRDRKTYTITKEDLVVLVAKSQALDYENAFLRLGERWHTYPKKDIYYIVPVRALEDEVVPVTCIYNWKQQYKYLPTIDANLFQIIERKDVGEGLTQTAITV